MIAYTPPQRQTLLFSATYPSGIEQISARVQRQPLNVEVGDTDEEPAIEQVFFETTREKRLPLLISVLSHYQPASCVVFCNTKKIVRAFMSHWNHVVSVSWLCTGI